MHTSRHFLKVGFNVKWFGAVELYLSTQRYAWVEGE